MISWFAPKRPFDIAQSGDLVHSPPLDWILEEYLDGSQHSLEVVGRPENYRVLQVTDLYVDQKFDCMRVIAPSNLPVNLVAEFERITLEIAEALNLHGIMDVEVICCRGEFKILEIDARLPSQTPTAVYWSTDQNMVGLLGDLYAAPQADFPPAGDIARGVVYEHIHVSRDILKISGEGIMAEGGPLNLQNNFFGADEAITTFEPGKDQWAATLIFSGKNRYQAWEKRNHCIAQIIRRQGINEVVDPQPVFDPEISGPLN
jgi:pyrrolysine biosynthesis protein PylC